MIPFIYNYWIVSLNFHMYNLLCCWFWHATTDLRFIHPHDYAQPTPTPHIRCSLPHIQLNPLHIYISQHRYGNEASIVMTDTYVFGQNQPMPYTPRTGAPRTLSSHVVRARAATSGTPRNSATVLGSKPREHFYRIIITIALSCGDPILARHYTHIHTHTHTHLIIYHTILNRHASHI